MLREERSTQIGSVCPLCDHGGEAVGADGPGDLADGEREAVHHGRKVGDDDHLFRLEAVRTPYLARHCQRNMVRSLPRGMSKIVDYW